jgi:hypothetical protein
VDAYFEDKPYLMTGWEGFSAIPYFHRPLRDYWRSFRRAGFQVDAFDEPTWSRRIPAELPAWRAEQANRIATSCAFLLSPSQ